MMIILLILVFQILSTLQENYDEDIDLAYPIMIYYRTANIYSLGQIQTLENVNNCSCRLLGELDAYCSGTSCITFPTKINTTAKYFRIKLTSIKSIEKDDFLSMENILAMDINANVKLERIAPGCFRNMNNLKNLSIVANVNLKHLDEKVFEGLVNVEQMFFQKNGFNHVMDITRSLSVKFVPNLQLLDMSENIFRYINHNEFHPMKDLKLVQLNMILCELEFVHPNSLLPLRHLKTLFLGQNTFNISSLVDLIQNTTRSGIPISYLSLYDIGLRKIIPNQLMQAIAQSNITSLSLANNHFDYIYDYDFPYMPNLIDLDLRSDFIADIDGNAFSRLPSLKFLRLGENKLFSVPNGALLKQIIYLDLSGNTIGGMYFVMQDVAFSKMVNLQNLQISYNTIFCLTNQSLIGLTNLLKLNLKRSDLYHIEEGSFVHVKQLQQLNLMENPINTFTAEVFRGLGNLKVLLLGGCNIQNLTITPNIFTHMPNLTYLGLEKTNLHTIYSNQFSHLNNLRTLNLADNKMTAWSKSILPQNLKILLAQQNKISYITNGMIEDFRNLASLSLDGNPFSCDCSFYSVVEYLKDKGTTINNLAAKNENYVARCIFPENWRQKSIIDYLEHLSNNENECKSSNLVETVVITVFSIASLCAVASILFCVYRKYIKKLFTVKLYKCNP